MVQLCVNCDDAAYECRQWIDAAEAFLTSVSTTLNVGQGLVNATSAETVANMALNSLDPRHEEERVRFAELRGEARKLIKEFWAKFKMFPIELNGRQASAKIVATSPTISIRHVGEDRLSAAKTQRRATKLSDDDVRALRQKYANPRLELTRTNFRVDAKKHGVSVELIRQIVLGKQRTNVK